jgi:predicted nucleotidyltransferase
LNVPRPDEANLAIASVVAAALGDLRESLVFVGGCATGLLVTSVRAQPIRMTDDVDLVAHVASRHDYHELEKRLSALGFVHDVSAEAPICRWKCRGVTVDLMPTLPGILGFSNRWYTMAVETAQTMVLSEGLTIRLIAAPVFLATKIEAFKGRGQGDFLTSHDLEDIITVVDGRDSLLAEVQACPAELKDYLGAEFAALMANDRFLTALPGHLPGDAGSQQRLGSLVAKLRRLASLSGT